MISSVAVRKPMKTKLRIIIGGFLVLAGLLVIAFSKQIVFPGLERLVGIEAIVGKNNVVYQPDGGYGYTNPRATREWNLSVAIVGILIFASGIWLCGIRIKFPAKKTLNAMGAFEAALRLASWASNDLTSNAHEAAVL